MIKAIKNWWKIIKHIKHHRNNNNIEFRILTTASEVIIYPVDHMSNRRVVGAEPIRLNYK